MNELEQCLNDKASLMRKLLSETQRQGEIVARGDIEALAQSLDARQALMDSMDALDSRIRGLGSPARSAAADRLRAEIGALLTSIMELDASNRLHAGEMAAALMTDMKEVKAEKKIMAYMGSESPGSKFINREG